MSRRFAIVPAGGSGSRFGTPSPKQFTLLRGQPLLVHTIAALLAPGAVEHVFVALSPEHQQSHTSINWALLGARVTPLWCAGETRAISFTRWIGCWCMTERALVCPPSRYSG